MKTRLMLAIISLLLACGACFHLPAASAADAGPDFTLSSSAQTVKVGSFYTVTLRGQGIKNMYAFQALFEYDPNYLEFVEVKKAITAAGTAVFKDRGTEVLFGFTKSGNAVMENGNMNLCTITFKAKLSGTTAIKLKSVDLLDNGNSGQSYTANKEWPVKISAADQLGGGNGNGNGNGSDNGSGNGNGNENGNGSGNAAGENGSNAHEPNPSQTADSNKTPIKKSVTAEDLAKAFKQAKQDNDGITRITYELSGTEKNKEYSLELPAQALISGGTEQEIVLRTPAGTVHLPGDMLKHMGLEGNQTITVSITAANMSGMDEHTREIIGNRPVIGLNILAGNKIVHWNNPDSPVKVSIDYQPTPEELKDPEHIVIVYIDDNDKLESVPTGKYDPITGKVTFITTHFSNYAVAVVYKTFGDIGNFPWAKDAIEVLASKGVINGISDKAFAPASKITRSDFIVMLVKGLGLSAQVDSNFGDIKETDYFYNSIGIAKKLGITGGVGGNKFKPGDQITRQDMFVIVARTLQITKKISAVGSSNELNGFQDANDIADYAHEGIATLLREGMIQGKGNLIDPKANATRAETAVLIHHIYSKY